VGHPAGQFVLSMSPRELWSTNMFWAFEFYVSPALQDTAKREAYDAQWRQGRFGMLLSWRGSKT